ncbi:hypothetical protein ACWEVD_01365 [Nocardia thailandica]
MGTVHLVRHRDLGDADGDLGSDDRIDPYVAPAQPGPDRACRPLSISATVMAALLRQAISCRFDAIVMRMRSRVYRDAEGFDVRFATGVALTLILAGVTTAGCSSSSSGGPAATHDADRDLAKASVLVAKDTHGNWPATGSPRSGTDATDDQGIWSSDLLKCMSVDPATLGKTTAWATSSPFVSSPYAANSRIEVLPTEEAAKARLATLSQPGFNDCAKSTSGTFWRTGDPDPLDTGQTAQAVARISNFPASGDELAAFRFKVSKVNGAGQINSGQRSQATIDVVAVRVGRVVAQLAFGAAPGALPPEWEKNMTQIVAGRIAELLSTTGSAAK